MTTDTLTEPATDILVLTRAGLNLTATREVRELLGLVQTHAVRPVAGGHPRYGVDWRREPMTLWGDGDSRLMARGWYDSGHHAVKARFFPWGLGLRALPNAWREICVGSIFSTGQSARSSPHSRLTERVVSWLWIKRRWKG